MPGQVDLAYDPVWGSNDKRAEVLDAIDEVRTLIASYIGSPPKYILNVVRDKSEVGTKQLNFQERDLRIIRYCLSVALGEEDI
jgi:hypothetical protein